MTKEEKLAIAAKTKEAINKDHGKNAVMALGDKIEYKGEVISTGSIGLNNALGIGGLPKGRVIEIYGPESSGKTTLAIHIIAEAQKKGGLCAFIDAEHAFDTKYATDLGVNIDELDINQPDHGEQGLEIANKLIDSGVYDVVVIDSVAALIPKAELEGQMGDSKMGLHARLMSQALRKLTATVYKNNVCLIFINQLREKIGVMFGNPETTTGGNALKFYASVRLDVRRSVSVANTVVENGMKVGNQTTVKVIKNKVAPPFRETQFDILYGVGIDKVGEILDIGSEIGLLKKWGKQITYNDEKYTLEDFTNLIYDNEGFYDELVKQINDYQIQERDMQPMQKKQVNNAKKQEAVPVL